jgi:hypothetical protein
MLDFQIESIGNREYYMIPENTVDHVIDHLTGVLEQLYQEEKPDIKLLENNLEEIFHVFGLKIPQHNINISRKKR